ncbi:MAG: type II secretion system protein [Bacilli bacterium]|nr:type II secretion system protein [Bacilli bacterium]
MSKKRNKGFTLVELLVVIVILTILASASILGYLAFTKKANESKAISELTQYKTKLIADLADGKEQIGSFTFTMPETNKIIITKKISTLGEPIDDLYLALVDYFDIDISNKNAHVLNTKIDNSEVNGRLVELKYITDKAIATWDIINDEITAVEK